MGEPWEPDPGIRAMLASIAKTQKALVGLASVDAVQQQLDQQLAPLLAWQQHQAGLTASLASAQTAMKPLLDALDLSALQQIAAGMPSLPDFDVLAEGWQRQSAQLRAGLQLLRTQAPPNLRLPSGTFDQAEAILEGLGRNPPAQDPKAVPDEMTAETEAQVEEAVQVIEPALSGMDRKRARALVVAYVSILVFLLSVHLSIAYPEVADLLTKSTGGDALIYASGAGWLAGRIWDRRHPNPDDPQ